MSKYTGPMHVPNKRAKKPQGAPKRAISSFLSFSQLMRPEIRLQYPHLKNTDVSSVLAQKWHEASDEAKRPHIERELRDREKYHEDMAAWKEGESERNDTDKSCAAGISEGEKSASFGQMGYINQHPSSSLWAAMIDVNDASAFDSGSNGPPLYDEAMVGFWDTEAEGGDNQFGCNTGSDPGSDKSDKNGSTGRFTSSVTKSFAFHPGNPIKPVKREIPLTTAKKSKEERLAKRAKAQRARPNQPHIQYPGSTELELPLTAQQLEIQQRRLQQQHQYQMYQQHLLKQKAKGEIQEPHNSQDKGRDGRNANRPMSSAGSIMEGGRLHSQSQANQRSQAEDPQFKQANYQGTQRNQHQPSMLLPWSLGLSGYPMGMDQHTQALAQVSSQASSFAQPPIGAYGADPYFATLQYPAAGYGYGLIDGIERYFFDAPTNPQPQLQSASPAVHKPEVGPGSSGQGQTSSYAPESRVLSPNPTYYNNSNDGVAAVGDTSMRSFQFDEQDRFCVMQTLMAVHRASASKAGDSETVRSVDRMQMAQQGAQQVPEGQGRGVPMKQNHNESHRSDSSNRLIESSSATVSAKDMKSVNVKPIKPKPVYCAPLSLQQQERQNQTERQQLKDRQMKQMQEMLQLQEREQAMQKQEHCSSMVTASEDRNSNSASVPVRLIDERRPKLSDAEESVSQDDAASYESESEL